MYRNCNWNCNWKNKEECDKTVYETKCMNIMEKQDDYEEECMCGFDEEENLFPRNPMFGQSYVPWQRMNKTFIPEVGLKMGTIFPELVSPYYPGQSMAEIEYLEETNKIGKGCNK